MKRYFLKSVDNGMKHSRFANDWLGKRCENFRHLILEKLANSLRGYFFGTPGYIRQCMSNSNMAIQTEFPGWGVTVYLRNRSLLMMSYVAKFSSCTTAGLACIEDGREMPIRWVVSCLSVGRWGWPHGTYHSQRCSLWVRQIWSRDVKWCIAV